MENIKLKTKDMIKQFIFSYCKTIKGFATNLSSLLWIIFYYYFLNQYDKCLINSRIN